MSDDTLASDPLVLKVARLRPDSRLPTKAHAGDAAFDLYAVESEADEIGACRRVPTGIAIELPAGWYAQILGRSSLAEKGFDVLGGVIDPGYRGEWIVNLWVPRAAEAFHFGDIQPGDKVAQFVLHRVPEAVVVEVGAGEMTASDRGSRGFGSSGR